jgi:hypothetical protein
MAWSRTEAQMRALLDRLSDDDLVQVAEFELGSAGKRSMPKGQLLRHIDRPRGPIGSQRLSHQFAMRAIILLLALLSRPVLAQGTAPRFLYIYRDSLKRGADSAYRAIEDDGAQICADLRCPNPYIGIESLSGSHEAWWINAFATEADTARVAKVYATNLALSTALGAVAQRKATLIGTPVQGFAVYRRGLSRGPALPVVGARFIVVTVTGGPVTESAWAMADSTLYVLHPVRTRREADALARQGNARVFAVRPNWSMPAPEWVAADPDFWRTAPAPRR